MHSCRSNGYVGIFIFPRMCILPEIFDISMKLKSRKLLLDVPNLAELLIVKKINSNVSYFDCVKSPNSDLTRENIFNLKILLAAEHESTEIITLPRYL